MTKIINVYGGPGTGKSTTAAHIFALLKQDGVNAELVTEYAKDKVWENSFHVLDDQLYVLVKQYHRMFRLLDKVDFIITDAPLLLSLYYGKHLSLTFKSLVVELYESMDNIDFFLQRVKPYVEAGRMQNEIQAREIDKYIKDLLDAHRIDYTIVTADSRAANQIKALIA